MNNYSQIIGENTIQHNEIKQVKVSELLDGRSFFIPSYQRGYRWTKQQIYDLCNDLLEYVFNTNKQPGAFYSLQPLIVRKGIFEIDGMQREAYEVIDGQQRLTTIFLMYRLLAKFNRYQDLSQVSEYLANKKLYHIFYQTRKEDYILLEKSGFDKFQNKDIKDIDIAHISNAYHYMECWFKNESKKDPECAQSLYVLYNKTYSLENVTKTLFDLLNDSDSNLGSVQFIWYEIDKEKDAIREFLTENKGKIGLTDTEKIRALFMQRKSNKKDDVKNLKQLSIAKDWELVENILHKNDFWSFISKDISMEDGRINIIFKYIFDNDPSTKDSFQEGDYLFRYYYRQLVKVNNSLNSLETNADNMWKQVMDCFRMLQNWYYNPKTYNLVGLLVKHGYSLKQISDIYNRENVTTHESFVHELNKEICQEIIDKICIKKGNTDLDVPENEEYISLFYNKPEDKNLIPDLLRFINVYEMNKTIDNALIEINKDGEQKKRSDKYRGPRDVLSHIYRFPFEALDVFEWDIEHIDSATTNSLTDPKEQIDWLKGAEEVLKEELNKEEYFKNLKNQVQELFEAKDLKVHKPTEIQIDVLKKMVNYIHSIVEEDEVEVRKHWIGNLTLLDSGTNRSYKNKIFAWKNNILQQRIRTGVFVPICTQNVFNKVIKGTTNSDWKWSFDDKKAYHSYILSIINQYKNEFSDQEKNKTEEALLS